MRESLSLRKKARVLWLQQQALEKREIKKRIRLEPQILLEKLREICGDEFEIKIRSNRKRVIAEVDGLLFASTYHDSYVLMLPSGLAAKQSGVCLWWECEKCSAHEESPIIRRQYELGKRLESFKPERTHKCRTLCKTET